MIPDTVKKIVEKVATLEFEPKSKYVDFKHVDFLNFYLLFLFKMIAYHHEFCNDDSYED